MSDQRDNMQRMEARFHGPRDEGTYCPAGFPIPAGTQEWVVEKGDKGEQGAKGDKGERGMSAGQRRAIIYLFLLNFPFLGVGLFWLAHIQNSAQSAQRAAGQIVEQKLCATLDQLAGLKPPAGNPATNPSRAYEDNLHTTLAQMGTDIGCPVRQRS